MPPGYLLIAQAAPPGPSPEFTLQALLIAAVCAILVYWRVRASRRDRSARRARSDESPSAVSPRIGPAAKTARRAGSGKRTLFICYRREDSQETVGRIYDALTQRLVTTSIYRDIDSIPLGVDFTEHVAQFIAQCDAVLVVIGREWLTAGGPKTPRLDDPHDYVRIEIEAALRRNVAVIPVFVQGATMPAEKGLPPSIDALTRRSGMAVRPDPDFHGDMDRLVAGLERSLSVS